MDASSGRTLRYFPKGFKSMRIKTSGAEIQLVTGGQGPPLLLLHGNPQTHIIWRKVIPELFEDFTVVASDIRGYGESSKPPTNDDHSPYSFREMAKDQVEVMSELGFESFSVIGHDRGGRVAHRMALDYPDRIETLTVLDVCPTHYMYSNTDKDFATGYYHWFFLIQPYDLPERLIGYNRREFLMKRFRQHQILADGRSSVSPFSDEVIEEYLHCFTPETIHAICEDYRASASIDFKHDQSDIDNGNKVKCPILCVWGEYGLVNKTYDVVSIWKKHCESYVVGQPVPGGHYVPEECPNEFLGQFKEFIALFYLEKLKPFPPSQL